MKAPKRERNRDELASSAVSPANKPSVELGNSLMDMFSDPADMSTSQNEKKRGRDALSNLSGSPLEAQLPAPVLTEIPNVFISEEVQSFLWNHAAIFDDLINLSPPTRFVDYLDENPTSYQYYQRLYNSLNALTDKFANEKLVKIVKRNSTGERLKKIEIDKLLKKLNPCKTDEAREFLSVLNEGITSWRLLKLVDIYYLAEDDEKKPLIDALIWLEKRRSFMKACMTGDHSLMRWLDQDKQLEMKTTLTEFTLAMQSFFSRTTDVSIVERVKKRIGKTLEFEDCVEPVIYKMPVIMDIRMLWHSFSFNHLVDSQDHIKNADALLVNGNNFLLENLELARFFFTLYPCPWTCFLEAFNGAEKETLLDDMLKVDHDILMWLFLSHVDNAELANIILSLSPGVDRVADAYAAHQKERIAAPLAESMVSILSPIHNSPTKEKRKPDPELQARSPKRKIENEFCDLGAPTIK